MSAMKSSGRFFTIGLVTAWYSSNIGVLLLNKYLLSNYGFKYPIFLTMCHMTACSLLSYVAIAWMKMVPMQTIRSRVQFMKISALSLIFCTSVVSGNVSLKYLPVSFNQAIGATTPFFTAVFAYMMTLKREAWLTYLSLVPVVTGVIIASGGEPSFHLFGFIMCVGATAARALKSVVQGILLSSEGEKLNSMNLLLYMAPIAVVLLLPATIYMEENVVGITLALAREDSRIIWLLLFNSALAYFVNLTNFLVTKHTSALTLQVLGNAKGAVAVVISILIFKNPVSVTGMLGLVPALMTEDFVFPRGSAILQAIKRVWPSVRRGLRWSIGDGATARFWKDNWTGSQPLITEALGPIPIEQLDWTCCRVEPYVLGVFGEWSIHNEIGLRVAGFDNSSGLPPTINCSLMPSGGGAISQTRRPAHCVVVMMNRPYTVFEIAQEPERFGDAWSLSVNSPSSFAYSYEIG
ncbi:Probable sugar phosphate/phosphate translocator [Striga hermonthica]|uniref:Probable sugar phosphate/phosphate translocator n=1 Tax=Striga hermonthica TaxID=68872 RepID=A0A9N7MKU3_STRHE|nr:Probable sugar phosphate/phosphate translocator [Striga hermonthica]